MQRRALHALLLVGLFLCSSWLAALDAAVQLESEHRPHATQQGAIGMVDVPTYRINDKWVYDTQFDVAHCWHRPTSPLP